MIEFKIRYHYGTKEEDTYASIRAEHIFSVVKRSNAENECIVETLCSHHSRLFHVLESYEDVMEKIEDYNLERMIAFSDIGDDGLDPFPEDYNDGIFPLL